MLSIEALFVSIDRAPILHDVSFSVPPGSTVGLVGRNGAGKTTLIRTIMGMIAPDRGSISFADRALGGLPAYTRARLGIGYMPEDRRLVPSLTVEENILVPVWATRREALIPRLQWIYGLMPEVGAFAPRKALQLSGGQQKLAALARSLMCGTEVLLLDEPFEGVAPALAQRLAEVLSDLKDEGLSVLLCGSDYTHSADLLDHVLVIERGRVEERSLEPPTSGQ